MISGAVLPVMATLFGVVSKGRSTDKGGRARVMRTVVDDGGGVRPDGEKVGGGNHPVRRPAGRASTCMLCCSKALCCGKAGGGKGGTQPRGQFLLSGSRCRTTALQECILQLGCDPKPAWTVSMEKGGVVLSRNRLGACRSWASRWTRWTRSASARCCRSWRRRRQPAPRPWRTTAAGCAGSDCCRGADPACPGPAPMDSDDRERRWYRAPLPERLLPPDWKRARLTSGAGSDFGVWSQFHLLVTGTVDEWRPEWRRAPLSICCTRARLLQFFCRAALMRWQGEEPDTMAGVCTHDVG